MKKPRAKTKLAKTPTAKLVETPLTDSWQATVQKGSTPGIFPLMWHDGFAVGHGTFHKFSREVRVFRYDQPFEHEGKKLHWAVEGVDYAEDKNTVLRIWKQKWFETEAEAGAGLQESLTRAKAEIIKAKAAQAAAEAHKPKSDEQDLTNARLKVMREQYPDTFKAMDAVRKALPEDRPKAIEALFRAYAVDLVRLHKPAELGEVSPFKSLPTDISLILQLAKAHGAKSPHNPVDAEIAANWLAEGYDKMRLKEYTLAINTKTGANLKPETMKASRMRQISTLPERRLETYSHKTEAVHAPWEPLKCFWQSAHGQTAT